MSAINGRHIAATEHKRRWWARQSRGSKVAIITLGLLLTGALTALALVFTILSAQDNFQGKDIGNINIGNVATQGIFPDSDNAALASLEPTTTINGRCFNIRVDSPQPGDDARVYVDTATGLLADNVVLTIEAQANPGATPGHASCLPGGTWTPVVSNMTLADWLTANGSFASGLPVLNDAGTQYRVFLSVTGTVSEIQGNTGQLVVAFENQN